MNKALSWGGYSDSELEQLRNQIRKSAIGYQDPAGLGDGRYSALVPQDLNRLVTNLTYQEQHLRLWRDIPKGDAKQTLHEFNRIVSLAGNRHSGFFGEGGRPSHGGARLQRDSVKIKYLGVYNDDVTSVANAVDYQGFTSAQALAKMAATRACMGRTEAAMIDSKAGLSSFHYSGIKEQIELDGGLVVDLRDEASLDMLEAVLAELVAMPRLAMPTGIYVSDRVYQSLSRSTALYQRRAFDGVAVTQGVAGLSVTVQGRTVPVVVAPFLDRPASPPVGATGKTPPATPTIVSITPASDAASKFIAADEGTYKYAVVAVSADGTSARVLTSAAAISAGDKVTIILDDASAKADADEKRKVAYYELYRTEKDGADATLRHIGDYPVNTDGGSSRTALVDRHERIYGASDIIIATMDPEYIEFVSLQGLGFVFNPLPQVETTFPFMVMNFGSPVVKAPERFALIKNVKARPSGLPGWSLPDGVEAT